MFQRVRRPVYSRPSSLVARRAKPHDVPDPITAGVLPTPRAQVARRLDVSPPDGLASNEAPHPVRTLSFKEQGLRSMAWALRDAGRRGDLGDPGAHRVTGLPALHLHRPVRLQHTVRQPSRRTELGHWPICFYQPPATRPRCSHRHRCPNQGSFLL